jgi:hypothetical protein
LPSKELRQESRERSVALPRWGIAAKCALSKTVFIGGISPAAMSPDDPATESFGAWNHRHTFSMRAV